MAVNKNILKIENYLQLISIKKTFFLTFLLNLLNFVGKILYLIFYINTRKNIFKYNIFTIYFNFFFVKS